MREHGVKLGPDTYPVTVVVKNKDGNEVRRKRTNCSANRSVAKIEEWARRKHGASALERHEGCFTEVNIKIPTKETAS